MCSLPYETHRYLVEPLSGGLGLRMQLVKKYLGFINRIKKSSKPVLQQLLNLTKGDVRTTTGANLRNILLMTEFQSIDDLKPECVANIQYNKITLENMWRVNIIKEILDIKHGDMNIPEGWTIAELEDILTFACVS